VKRRGDAVRLTGRRKGTHSSKGRELKLPSSQAEWLHARAASVDGRHVAAERTAGVDFASLVGVGKDTLYKWKQQFRATGARGLLDQPARRAGREPPAGADQADDL